jgi:hypothetical protein
VPYDVVVLWCGKLGPCYVGKEWPLPSITVQNTFSFSLPRLIAVSCVKCARLGNGSPAGSVCLLCQAELYCVRIQ